jgi:Fur family ferric uptake transcriptional regulator
VSVPSVPRRRTAEPDHGIDQRIVSALAGQGQRLTRHKAAVIAALADIHGPVTADAVVAASGVPTSTAYRILAELADALVVARVAGADRIDRFEVAEAFTDHHHHHLVCTTCGAVQDFEPGAAVERAVASELSAVAASHGFAAARHVFDVHGTCASCLLP